MILLDPFRFAAPAGGSISFINATISGTSGSTPGAHQIGDLIVVVALNKADSTAIGTVAGYTSLITGSVSGVMAARIAWKIAESTAESGGSWPGSTRTQTLVYRGAHATTPFGNTAKSEIASASVTPTLPALTPSSPPALILGAILMNTNTLVTNAYSGFTQRTGGGAFTWTGDTNGASAGIGLTGNGQTLTTAYVAFSAEMKAA
jgi:hypothetical protein